MAAGDHGLLNIPPIDEQLTDSSAVAIEHDSTKADRPSDNHSSKVIPGIPGPLRLSTLSSQLGGVDARQPDPLTVNGPAGIAVVAAPNGDGLQGRNRICQCQQQQRGS